MLKETRVDKYRKLRKKLCVEARHTDRHVIENAVSRNPGYRPRHAKIEDSAPQIARGRSAMNDAGACMLDIYCARW